MNQVDKREKEGVGQNGGSQKGGGMSMSLSCSTAHSPSS